MRTFSLDLKFSNPHVVRSGFVSSVIVNLRIGAQQQHHHCYLHFYWIRMLDPSPTSRTKLLRPAPVFFQCLMHYKSPAVHSAPRYFLLFLCLYFSLLLSFLTALVESLRLLFLSNYSWASSYFYMYIYGPHSSRLIFPQSFGSSQTLRSFILRLKWSPHCGIFITWIVEPCSESILETNFQLSTDLGRVFS